ncbi:MAG: DUF4124 domain-containing protein [Xanthomonadaceae bacterium]|jgi:hypothetical protein|nr:DUF4124 domain-containing protein [Xanthomonadaceae bacterium]
MKIHRIRLHLLLCILSSISANAWCQQVTFYRCTDAEGVLTIQNQPCPAGSKQEARVTQGVRSFSPTPVSSGPASSAPAATPSKPAAPANPAPRLNIDSTTASTERTVFYQCTDAAGEVALQNNPCPAGSRQETKVMQGVRSFSMTPATPPAASAPAMKPPAPAEAADSKAVENAAEPEPEIERTPPPHLFRCTTPEQQTYFSEEDDPKPRCIPLHTVGLDGNPQTGAGEACEVVRDQCERIPDKALCDNWKQYLQEAENRWRFAHPDNASRRQEEYDRLAKIVRESTCSAPAHDEQAQKTD